MNARAPLPATLSAPPSAEARNPEQTRDPLSRIAAAANAAPVLDETHASLRLQRRHPGHAPAA